MVNEAYRILDEGIAARESDIDLVWVNGYGFPREKGGPMHWARRIGLSEVCRRLSIMAERFDADDLKPGLALMSAR